jgi:DNA-binding CsgD family transcriptional regulator
MNLDTHISLTSCSVIQEITKPLLETLGVGYFSFQRAYADRKAIRLSTYPEWTKHYISQGYFGIARVDYCYSLKHDYEYYRWEDFALDGLQLPVLRECYNDFHLRDGFTIIKQYRTYLDQYSMAATEHDLLIGISVYLRMIQFIENFIPYFLQQAQSIIKEANKIPFLLPGFTPPSPARTDRPYEVTLNYFSQKTQPTRREMQCFEYLVRGKTAKEIARELRLSPRTVEYYLDNFRKKIGCRNRYELISEAYRNPVLATKFPALKHFQIGKV